MSELKTFISAIRNGDTLLKIDTLIFILDHNIELPVRYLHEALTDKNKKVRATAAFILSKRGNKNSLKHLLKAWSLSSNNDLHLRRQIIIAITDITGMKGLKNIISSFSQWHITLQSLVIEYVAQLRNKKSRSSFIDVLKDQDLSKRTLNILKKNNIIWE